MIEAARMSQGSLLIRLMVTFLMVQFAAKFDLTTAREIY